MMMLDVNILMYAYREDLPEHSSCVHWLLGVLNGPEPFGMTNQVMASFLRIAMDERIFPKSSRFEQACDFIDVLRSDDKFVLIQEGPRHWNIFSSLCRVLKIKSQQIPDAYLAAVAIEQGHELITVDKGFKKYPGLKFRNPLV